MKRCCPKCLSTTVRVSSRHGLRDRLCSWFGYFPFRCSACRHRFHAESSREERRLLVQQQLWSKAQHAFAGVTRGLW